MRLVNFPPEIILIIVKQLDLKSIECMYHTCRYFRDIVQMKDAVKQCWMSMNAMATTKTLKSQFFKDIARHLQELNMSRVSNLYKTQFNPVLKKLNSLITLDVSYTSLNLSNLGEICRTCPTIKNVCINIIGNVSNDMLCRYQEDFKKLENIHLVGSFRYYDSALLTLLKAKLDSIKFTAVGKAQIEGNIKVKCKWLCLYFFNLDNTHILGSLRRCSDLLQKTKFEYIVINKVNLSNYCVYSSPLFNSFFSNQFGLDTELIDMNEPLRGNTAVLAFDKEQTVFDDVFFRKLSFEVSQYLPYFCKANMETSLVNSDWFYITPTALDVVVNKLNKKDEPYAKKKRIGESNFVLNYDEIFKEKQKVKLSIGFKDHNIRNPVALSAGSEYLKKITFLSLSGRTCYSSNFFNVLFQNCTNLFTLDIECQLAAPQCILDLAKYIPTSKCLKNIRISSSRIQFNRLFKSLSECRTLEYISIEDSVHYMLYCNEVPIEFGDPTILIEKCDNLYGLYIQAPVSYKARVQITNKLNKVRASVGKCYLSVAFLCKYSEQSYIRPDTHTYPKDVLPFDIFRS